MQEVHGLPFDGGRELRILVEPRLVFAPIIGRAPVLGQFLKIPERHAAAPVNARLFFGPAGVREAIAQVVEVGLRYVDEERLDRGISEIRSRRSMRFCLGVFQHVVHLSILS